MPKKVEILQENQAYQNTVFRVVEAKLRHEKFDGSMTDEMIRLNWERGDAVAAIVHNPDDDTILLVEQFRYPTHRKTGDGWLLEVPAGIVGNGEQPSQTMRREIEEETGYAVNTLHHIYTFFLSPGGSSERIFLYYGRLSSSEKVADGGGVKADNEFTRTIILPIADALKKLREQEFKDAKTIIALQWLDVNRLRLNHLTTPDS